MPRFGHRIVPFCLGALLSAVILAILDEFWVIRRNYVNIGTVSSHVRNGDDNLPRNTRNDHPEKHCISVFPENLHENMNLISKYLFNISEKYRRALGFDERPIVDKITQSVKHNDVPVFVSAASANHFDELQALFENIHRVVIPKYKSLRFIFYDIGLTKWQKELLERHCQCDVRTFPFDEYPAHVKQLGAYAWKPIIIQLVLLEHDFVMWMDTSIRLAEHSLRELFSEAAEVGVKVVHGTDSINEITDTRTFNFLNENPFSSVFKVHEVGAGWILLKRSAIISNAIMKPWVSCALTPACMLPPGAKTTRLFTCIGTGCAHRFDQSVLSILLIRLFGDKYHHTLIDSKFGSAKREQKSDYFYRLNNS